MKYNLKLAAEMGVSIAAVSKWENGNSMPGICRLELLKTIKAQNADIKVIMVTGEGSEKIKRLAISYGADGYITKPFLPEHIKSILSIINAI